MQELFLCLSELLDQDLSSYEYFHSLPLEVQKKIEESDVNSFADMQQIAEKIKSEQTQKKKKTTHRMVRGFLL